MSEPRHTLTDAVRALAGHCDWAATKDDVGYNGSDAPFGHRLAALPEAYWTASMQREAWEMLRKYQRQLAAYGVRYELIPEPPRVAVEDARQDARRALWRHEHGQAPPARSVTMGMFEGRPCFEVRFPYDAQAVAEARDVPGRRWDGARKVNVYPVQPETVAPLLRFAAAHELEIHPDVREAIAGLPQTNGNGHKPPFNGVDCDEDGVEFRITFPRDERLINTLKSRVPGRVWDPDRKHWKVKAEPVAAAALRHWAETMQLRVSEAAEALIGRLGQEMQHRLEASRAASAELTLDGFGVEPYPFQLAGILYLQRVKRGLCGDDMGLGKTIQGLGLIHLEQLYPAVVICPAVVKYNWLREAMRCLKGKRILAADSNTTELEIRAADVIITNYDVLKIELDNPAMPKGKYHAVGLLARLIARNPKIVVFDEMHYCKNSKAIRSKAATLLAAGREWRIGLTGTPFLNRPNEGISQLKILGRLNDLGGYKQYTDRYCGAYNDRYGHHTSGHGNLIELNERLRATCMIRRLKGDVLKELPAKQRTIVPVDLSNRKEYDHAERDLIAWLIDTAEDERTADARVAAALRAEQLVRMSKLKQLAAKGKIAWVKDWVADFLESGEKLVLFAHHREVVDALAREFKAPSITGDTSMQDRQRAVDRFQQDPETRLIVCNIQAAGVGITLTAASNVAFVELAWTPGAHTQAEDRVHRIGQEAESVNAWYLLGRETIDDDNYELLQEKAKVVSSAADGVETDMGASVAAELVGRLRARAMGREVAA